MQVLSIQNLSKSYGNIEAVKDLSLDVHAGQILGLLGPNGSGKTTTLGMILDIIRPDTGTFQWFENRFDTPIGRKLGVLLETPNFYPYLSADENLSIVRHLKKSSETNFDELLELVNLKHRRRSNFQTFSLGMKQRLAIAAAMVGDPEVLILDEPTNGLDPEGIADVRKTIVQIAGRGKTVILASHILMEVEKVCSHVAILKQGSLLASGAVGSILSNDIIYEIGATDLSRLKQVLSRISEIDELNLTGNFYQMVVAPGLSIHDLNRDLLNAGLEINHLRIKKQMLEEEFLEIVK